jgi:[ribosomal protein S18]-alanine N-acetyltransferase
MAAIQMIDLPDIGLATLADAQSIALISRDEIEQGLRWAWTPPRVRNAIEDRETNVVVARNGTSVIGFALMRYRLEDAHLLLLAVIPDHRRKGVATAMLGWLEETLKVAGIAAIQVEVRASNRVALAFYAALGYEQVDATSRYYQGIETAVHLVKELGSA